MPEISSKQRVSVGLLAGILIPAAAGFIAWGSNLTRVQEIERHIEYQDTQIQETRTQMAAAERSLAVEDAQYTEILRRLEIIDKKVDHP